MRESESPNFESATRALSTVLGAGAVLLTTVHAPDAEALSDYDDSSLVVPEHLLDQVAGEVLEVYRDFAEKSGANFSTLAVEPCQNFSFLPRYYGSDFYSEISECSGSIPPSTLYPYSEPSLGGTLKSKLYNGCSGAEFSVGVTGEDKVSVLALSCPDVATVEGLECEKFFEGYEPSISVHNGGLNRPFQDEELKKSLGCRDFFIQSLTVDHAGQFDRPTNWVIVADCGGVESSVPISTDGPAVPECSHFGQDVINYGGHVYDSTALPGPGVGGIFKEISTEVARSAWHLFRGHKAETLGLLSYLAGSFSLAALGLTMVVEKIAERVKGRTKEN